MTTDPFAYLEDGTAPATIAWQEAQNARARAALDAVPHREELRARFDALMRAGSLGAPVVRGARTFFASRTGTQEQALISLEGADGADRVLLDPAALDPTGLTALDWWYPSRDGRYVAYGLSKNGDEASSLFVLDVESGANLPDTIPRTRWTSLAWLPDHSGFYYTASPDGTVFNRRLLLHALGSDPATDRVVFGEGRAPEEMIDCDLSSDGRWLVAGAHLGWSASEFYLADLRSPAGDRSFRRIFKVEEGRASVAAGSHGLVALTTEGAPRGRVYLIDPERIERDAWQEIVPEGDDVLHFAAPVRSGVLVGGLRDVMARLALRTHDGRVSEIPLGIASIGSIATSADSDSAYVTTTTFFEPATVHRLELGERGATVVPWRALASPVDGSRYLASQTWCTSADGTRVPMFVLARRDTPRDGTAPAIVYGYGGFDVAVKPDFNPAVIPWLDAGGVYVVTNLRGGSEFGLEWHVAGMRANKQNVFDDYAAAFGHLARNGYADPARIAAFGGSNGGLLVGALATQHPELARAVVCAVPVLDMLRYHRFSIGRLWIPEYGDPDVPADAAYLGAYSPYENVRPGTAYPAMLVLAAMSDSRVDPAHARKFAAKLQAAGSGDAPIYCYVESEAGHGQGKPRRKQLDDLVDRYSFLAWQLGVDPARLAGIVTESPSLIPR